jgi:putative nucleotidyltransferase with HDIG domain
MLEEAKEIARKECDAWNWRYHLLPVAKNARLLAKKLGANEELVETAAFMHDMGRIRFGESDHASTGSAEAAKILKGMGCSQEALDEITGCIETHHGPPLVPKTLSAKVLANAHAMAPFDVMPAVLYSMIMQEHDFERAVEKAHSKIESEWEKITLFEAREMAQQKYDAAKLMCYSIMEYMKEE